MAVDELFTLHPGTMQDDTVNRLVESKTGLGSTARRQYGYTTNSKCANTDALTWSLTLVS